MRFRDDERGQVAKIVDISAELEMSIGAGLELRPSGEENGWSAYGWHLTTWFGNPIFRNHLEEPKLPR